MKRQVIEILSDNEEQQQFKTKEVQILQRQINQEASLIRSNTAMMLDSNKQLMSGTSEEKEQILTERIKKMFMDKQKFDIQNEHFCVKREPNYNLENSQLQLNEILVYGTDFWPTRQIKMDSIVLKIPVEVHKIDDSHSKIRFLNLNDAVKWLNIYIQSEEVKSKIEEEGIQIEEEMATETKIDQVKLKGWFKLKSYYYLNYERKRQARFCISAETNIQSMKDNIKTTNYEKFRQQIEKEMLQQEKKPVSYQMADERRRNQKRHNEDSYKQNERSYHRSEYKRQKSRSRDKYKTKKESNKYDRKQERSRRKSKERRNRSRDHYKETNRSRTNSYFHRHETRYETRRETRRETQHENRLHQSNLEFKIANDNESNISQMMENNDNINSITNALNQMDLEDNPNNLSIELAPVTPTNQNLDMSVVIDPVAQSKNNKSLFLKGDGVQLGKTEMKQKPKQSQGQKKQKQSTFDYMKYIEQSEKESMVFREYKPK